jgi:hypothetical protein
MFMVVSRHQKPSVIFTGSQVAAGTGTVVPPGTGVFIVVAVFARTAVFAGAGVGVFWIAAGVLVALAVSPVFNSNRHPAPVTARTRRKTRAIETSVRMCGNRLLSQKTLWCSNRKPDVIFPCGPVGPVGTPYESMGFMIGLLRQKP